MTGAAIRLPFTSGRNFSIVLTIKRRNKPHGIMACEGFAPGVLSLELSEDYGVSAVAETGATMTLIRERRLRQALARLEPQERRAVLDYLDGMKPARRSEKNSFDAALEKRATYLSTYRTASLGCKIGEYPHELHSYRLRSITLNAVSAEEQKKSP